MKKEARMERSETHRPYSWWWDSHRPKNSKWIQENLTDMDMKIKAMLKLIEQDADSFAQRAEMYYKKRPELVQLVEEFYRAYRALAERCDHITGELRQIHHSISEAFPNELRMINGDAARDGQSPDETDEARDASRLQGLKHLSEIFAEYGTTEQKLSELREELKSVQEQNQKIKEEWTSHVDEINDLKGKIESLQNRNEELNQQGHLLNEKLQNETEEREKLKAEIVTYENLQSNLTLKEEENKKLQSELLSRDLKIKDIEEKVSSVEKEKDVLQQEMEKIITKMSSLAEELTTSRSQEQRLRSRLQEETDQAKNLEAALTSYQESLNDSQEQQRVLTEEIKAGTERLKEADKRVKLLEEEIVRLQAENANLIERVSSATVSIRNLEDEVLKLKQDKNNLLREVAFRVDQNNDLQKKLYGLQEEKNDVDHRYQTMLQQLASVGLDAGSFHSCYISLQEDNQKLKDLIKEHQDENVRMGSNIHELEEKLQEKNRGCEDLVLSHAEEVHRLNNELEKQQSLCENLQNQISDLLSEKIKSSEQTNVLEANLHDFKEKLGVLEGENLKLSAELVSSFDHAKHLNDELNTLQVEKEKCEQEIRARDTTMSDLEIEASSLQAEVDRIKLELQEKSENAEESELELGRLKEMLSEIESKNIKLTDECQQLAHENTIVKLRVKELEWEIHVKQEEKAALSNELTSELKGSSELKEELKKLQHLLSLSENETDDAGMEARSVVNAIFEKVKQLQSDFFDSENENERLSIAATSLSSYLEKLELQMAALQSEKASVSAEAESSSSLLEESQKEIRLLQKTTDELRIEMQYSLEREACLEKEIRDLKHSLVSSQDEQLLLHAQHQEILEEYYSLKKKFGDLGLRLSRSEEESFNNLSEALANAIFSAVLESCITEREIQMQKLLELVTDMRKEREVHEDQLQEAVGNSKLLGDEILQLKRLVLVLREDKNHTEKLQEESDNLKDQNSELFLKVDALEHAVEEKGMIIVGLGHKLEEIQEKNETLSRELELRQQEQVAGQVFLKELELQLASSSNQVNNLKEELSTASKNNIIMEEKLQNMAKEMEVKDEELSCSHGRERMLTSDLKRLHEREENVRIELQSLVEQNKLLESEIEKMYAALQLKQMEITLLKDGNEKIYDLCRLLASKSMDAPGGHQSTQQDKVKQRIDADDKVLLRNELARIIIGMQSENNNNDVSEKFARILGLLLPMKDDICCLKEEVLGQINALRNDARVIQDFFEQMLEANCELSAEAETRAQDVIRLQAEVDAIQHILIEMKRKNQNLQDESQRIIKELWNVKARLQSVLNRNIHLESQNRSLKAELHQQTQKAFQMQEDRSVAENESNLRSTELETLKSELKIAKDLESSSLRLCEMLLGQTAEGTSINPESFQAAEERLRKLYDELLQLRNENENLKNDAYLRFLSRSREMQHEGYQNESDSIAMELLKEKCGRLETQVEKLSENAAKFETKSYEAQVLAMKLEETQQAMSNTQQLHMQIQGLQARVKSLRKENVRLKSELKGELTSSRSLKYKDGLNNKDVDADEEPPLLQEEKEVVVDESKVVANQEHVSQELDTLLDENRKYWNRVGFSTKQIQNLQSSVQELQLKLKSLKGNKKLKGEKWGGLDMNLLEKQLRELQGQVMQLGDHNNKLKKDVKFGFAWANSVQDAGGQDRKLKVDEEVPILCRQNSKIAERLDVSADKARIMEMEVQRIRLLLSRFQVQQKPVVDDGAKMRVPLRAFLVGSKKDQQSKKHGCCTRPATVE